MTRDPIAAFCLRACTALACPALVVLSLALGAVLAARVLNADSARTLLDRARVLAPVAYERAEEMGVDRD